MTRSKYGNKKVTLEGIVFDSTKESRRWTELSLLQKAGHISKLERQRVFVLAPAVTLDGRKKPELRYLSDFSYINSDGALVVEDTKSAPTKKLPAYRIKKHLMMHLHQLAITEV